MKKIKITGPVRSKQLGVPRPKAKGDWVLVKIMVAPMCTEYEDFSSGAECECLGHEADGEVVEVDSKGYVNEGDRVVVMPQYPCGKCDLCKAGDYIYCENTYNFLQYTGSDHGSETYAQYILKPSWLLAKIPDSMSYEHASMLCCGLGPTFGAMKEMGTGRKDCVLITGLGPVGLRGIINGIYRGAQIIGVSLNPYRNKLVMELGVYRRVLKSDSQCKQPAYQERINAIWDLALQPELYS
jgi:L-iditol 2-dehydrogenase